MQLDQRETDCLEEIARLNSLKTNSTKSPTRTNSRMGSRESLYDKNKVNVSSIRPSELDFLFFLELTIIKRNIFN